MRTWKCSPTTQRRWLHHVGSILNTAQWHTLKQLIAYYMNTDLKDRNGSRNPGLVLSYSYLRSKDSRKQTVNIWFQLICPDCLPESLVISTCPTWAPGPVTDPTPAGLVNSPVSHLPCGQKGRQRERAHSLSWEEGSVPSQDIGAMNENGLRQTLYFTFSLPMDRPPIYHQGSK